MARDVARNQYKRREHSSTKNTYRIELGVPNKLSPSVNSLHQSIALVNSGAFSLLFNLDFSEF